MTAQSNREFHGSEPEPGDPNRHNPVPELTGSVSAEVKVSSDSGNGVVVYKRNKRLKTNGNSSGKVVNMDVTMGNSVIPAEVEVKEEESRIRRFTRSALGKELEIPNSNSQDERSGVTMSGTPKKKLEMKMSKKISITGIPTTVKELFGTGLLEGYPVFYSGKKGIPLRGTIKDTGILCFCDLCKGTRVVPPSKFEIHACNSYRRASEYICLENGKSLLDVVKECRKGSLKTLEETIQSVIGPFPVKRSLICRDCKGSFVATLAGKDEQPCDSCILSLRSEATPTQSLNTENGFIPFSGGPRKCVGDQFALLEATVALAILLQNFSFELIPDQNISMTTGATIHTTNARFSPKKRAIFIVLRCVTSSHDVNYYVFPNAGFIHESEAKAKRICFGCCSVNFVTREKLS